MFVFNDINQNLFNGGDNLILAFSSLKGNYEKYGNLIICFNFVLLSYSVISFILLARVFEFVQEKCRGYTITFSLNLLCLLTYMIASVLIGIAVKKQSNKYFRKYMILLVGCLLTKTAQLFFYMFSVKRLLSDKVPECSDISLIEEKEATYFMDYVCYCFALYVALKLKGFLWQMIEINKRLDEMGVERNNRHVYDSEEWVENVNYCFWQKELINALT